jgi:4-hydroxy-tetrahydrodipicolinate synthase
MRRPLTALNRDEKRNIDQVVRVLKTTIAAITAEA